MHAKPDLSSPSPGGRQATWICKCPPSALKLCGSLAHQHCQSVRETLQQATLILRDTPEGQFDRDECTNRLVQWLSSVYNEQQWIHEGGLYLVQWLSSEIKLRSTHCSRYGYIHTPLGAQEGLARCCHTNPEPNYSSGQKEV